MQDERTSTPSHEIAAPAERDATPQPPSASTSFWHLPYELRHLIILTACGPPVHRRHTKVNRSTECTTTMLALLRTARVLYPIITPLLYSHVRLTRPSALKSFQQTLAARPSLGRVVKALHIGPDEALPIDWFPMRRFRRGTPRHRLFTLVLGGSRDTNGSWVRSQEYDYDMTGPRGSNAKRSALYDAFDTAARYLNVALHPEGENHDHSGQWLGSDVWVVRVLKLRATLELYYLELQRWEAQQRRLKIECMEHLWPPYPRLKMESSSCHSSGERDDELFYVTLSDIVERLASPGAPTDSFSHPILFARSGLPWVARDFDGDTYDSERNKGGKADNIPDPFLEPRTSQNLPIDEDIPGVDGHGVALHSVGGNLALAGSVLWLTPHVRCLSMTGFFARLVTSTRAPCDQALASLTIGPTPAGWWDKPLQLSHSALRGIKKLRICGEILLDEEIACITGEVSDVLPNLTTFQWSMVEEADESNPDE